METQLHLVNIQDTDGSNGRLVITVPDQLKMNLLLEFLSHLDFVRIRKEPSTDKEWNQETQNAFLATAGIWKDRNINAAELRQQAWQRPNSGS